jgi:nucleoside-diphosphate-sugar epimerase
MRSVAITGVSGAIGRRVVAKLADRSDWEVVGIDVSPFPEGVVKPRHFTVHRADIRSADCRRLLDGVDAVVHLASPDPDQLSPGEIDDSINRLLGGMDYHDIEQLVVMSSAAVYGAYPENPIPLLESSALTPNPGFAFGESKVRLESDVNRWRSNHSNATAAVLRPAVTLGHPDSRAWLAKAVRPSLADRLGHGLPSMQFLHVDDLANAVVTALDQRLDGPFNVAADDWIVAEQAHELLGPNLRLPLPDWLLDVLVWVTHRFPGRGRPVGALPLSRHPWVVAVDRLKATGWAPQSTSAEAFVANTRQSGPARYYAKHRQEVTLAAVTLVAFSVVGLAATFVRRWRRSR